MTLLILLLAGTSLLIVGLAVPLILERIKPNHWYGLRLSITLNNPDVWYPANRYAGWLLLVYGLVLLVVSLVLPLPLSGFPEETAAGIYGMVLSVVMLAGLVPVVVLSVRTARKLAKECEAESDTL